MAPIKLTPAQVISLYGFFPQTKLLTWDWVDKHKLKFSYLHRQLCIPQKDLHKLQPDVSAWVKNDLVSLQDIIYMNLWPLNPLTHLSATVDDLIGLTAAQINGCSVDYDLLVEHGLTPGMMNIFHFTLNEWISIGFSVLHVNTLKEDECRSLFGGGVQQTIMYLEQRKKQ
eukprot:1204244-Rhodomonas_salina.1